ncbi:RNA-guided endonuclease InsQ/TnpB family protein, partial [Saccharothrix luteola]|uniref:RNA-guided endonuclease InsQ/TnpB family protein n=1 Tax=Saccharothrix luteola TaxID=2893018 RepID=UPI001E2DC0EF
MLNRTFGCVRLVWHKALAERDRRCRVEGKRTSYRETDALLTAWKQTEGLAFLSEVSSVPLQQTLRHQHVAFRNFFAGPAKTSAPSDSTWSFDQVDVTALHPTMAVVSRDPDGRWYVTFAVDTDEAKSLPATGHDVGADLGLRYFLVTSDGDRVANQRHLDRKARNLARHQRRLARSQRESNNRRKAKAKVARAHRKVRNARHDFLHRTSTNLVRSADLIAIEDLAVGTMVRNRRLARAIADAGWGGFRRQLEHEAAHAGRTLAVIYRWYPSTKRCSTCGEVLAEPELPVLHWTCHACRTHHDRDLNAAKNILAAGRVAARGDSGDACGADVRRQGPSLPRSATKQETRTRGGGGGGAPPPRPGPRRQNHPSGGG